MILEIPYEQSRYLYLKYKSQGLRAMGGGLYTFPGRQLPTELKQFTTEDFSYARWVEDDWQLKNKLPTIPNKKSNVKFTPRPHQLEGAKAIYKAYHTNNSGFLLGDKTGLGKTLTGLSAVTAIAKKDGATPQNKKKLLVVCPKGVIPVWRQTIHNYPAAIATMRILVINYQQLNKLIETPKEAKKAKKAKTKNRVTARAGKSTVDWDYIIFDEAHMLKNFPQSTVSVSAATIARLNSTYVKGKSPFVVYSTATPGSSPLNFAMMAPWLSKLLSATATKRDMTPDGWGDYLMRLGFAVKKGKVNYTWASIPWYGKDSDDPKERLKYERAAKQMKLTQRKDSKRIGQALTKPNAPFIMRSPSDIAGWPEQQYIALPLELTPSQRPVYEEAWSTFRNWLKLTPAKSDPKGALVQQLRYRQKASLLKVPAVADNITQFVEDDKQVFVSVEFIETLDAYKTALESKGIVVAEISGRNVAEREEERLKFQKGIAKVVLCTVVAGISLHAEETLPDGSKATSAERVSILSDLRQNPLDTLQSAGRAHRDGKASITYIPFLVDTVDSRVVNSFVNKVANLKTMIGSNEAEAEELEQLFREAVGE